MARTAEAPIRHRILWGTASSVNWNRPSLPMLPFIGLPHRSRRSPDRSDATGEGFPPISCFRGRLSPKRRISRKDAVARASRSLPSCCRER
jgi:hypothetical protein